jgi:hypothetical protein
MTAPMRHPQALRDQIISWVEAGGNESVRVDRIGLLAEFLVEEFRLDGYDNGLQELIGWVEKARPMYDSRSFDLRR